MRRSLQLFALLIIILSTAITILYIFNKPHRDIGGEEALYSLTLAELRDELVLNEDSALQKYLNNVIELSGAVASIEKRDSLTFLLVIEDNGAMASGDLIESNDSFLELVGKKVRIKGLFIGYDNLLEEINLSNCLIIQPDNE